MQRIMEADSISGQPLVGVIAPLKAYASKKLALFAFAGLSFVFLISALWTPSTGNYFTVCGFKNFTGLPCPGCGLTHSFCALAKGEVLKAFEFNLLGPILFLVLTLVWMRAASVLVGRTSMVEVFDRVADRINLVRAFGIGFLVYGIARIVYLLAFGSVALQESPLSRLVAGIFR